MPVTTFVHDSELNRPTPNKLLNELLQDARSLSGRNWQIIWTEHIDKRFLRKATTHVFYQLMLEVPGIGPWQIVETGESNIELYLRGYLSGFDDAARAKPAGRGLTATVLWTEICNAMKDDGIHTINGVKAGPKLTVVLRDLADQFLTLARTGTKVREVDPA